MKRDDPTVSNAYAAGLKGLNHQGYGYLNMFHVVYVQACGIAANA